MPLGETITAPATPAGQSAIALVRASGPDVLRLIIQAFKENQPPSPRKAILGMYYNSQDIVLDQVLYTYFPQESSYTGEPLLEIACHGNPLIVHKITEDLVARGCRLAEGGEFTRTAYLNGKLDLSQAEAVCDLITARSERALKLAQQQLRGSLGKKVAEYTDVLIQTIAEVEAYIDFPEEDLPPEETRGPKATLMSLVPNLQELIEKSKIRRLLQEGIQTVIIGPPNAGKSSLLNCLLGEERSIVSPTPGTTRDFITEPIMMGPFCIKIIDTAGLHATKDAIEQMGIGKTLEKIQEADFHLLVVDQTEAPPAIEPFVLEFLTAENTIILLNKNDLGKMHEGFVGFLPEFKRCGLSLKTEQGVPEFREKFIQTLENELPEAGSEDILVNARHRIALEKAQIALEKALKALNGRSPTPEVAASELYLALDALGEIVGKIDNEQILDKLFSTFCIGK